MNTSEREHLVLAALLHDIGKFAQRAERPKSGQLEGELCPSGSHGHSTHLHVLYTDHFIENDLPLPSMIDKGRLARLAAAHHKPAGDSLPELILCRADRLSAGMDRIAEEDSAGDYKSSRLLSTFSQVRLRGDEELSLEKAYYRLSPLETDPFPYELTEARKTGYKELFERFLDNIKKVPTTFGLRQYIASLDSILEKYTWCIPSSTYKNEPDISLYDHATTTAAIAQALAVYHCEQGGVPGQPTHDTQKFLLLGGDLSGIQSYIFGLEKSHGAGVAKILRARSFYLQALTKSVITSLLQGLGLLPQAKVMDAGGRFMLLLPATASVVDRLPAFDKSVQAWFFKRFGGRLALNLTYDLGLSESDFDQTRFKDRLDELSDRLDSRKLRKFNLLFSSGLPPVPDEQEDYALGACAVCQSHPVSEDASRRYEEEHERPLSLCRECADNILRIGKRLPYEETRFLVLMPKGAARGGFELFDGIFGRFEEHAEKIAPDALEIINLRERGVFTHHAIAGHLPLFTEDDVVRWEYEGRSSSADEPVSPGTPKTFGQLAEEARIFDEEGGLRGKVFLAALKADVDNLGMIFGMGFGDKLSLSRFAGLSRMFNHFFAEYLVARIKKEFPDIYVVYAGGDDLFLLGPWTDVLLFAKDLVEQFRRYVARNPELTLSAGMFVGKAALPVHAMAREAEELLERSKGFVRKAKAGKSKNAFTLFDVTDGWEAYAELMAKGDWLERLIVEGKVPSGLGMRLLGYAEACRAFRSGEKGSRGGLYVSHMAYDFSRNLKKDALGTEDFEALAALRSSPETLEKMRLSVSYALYRIRNDQRRER